MAACARYTDGTMKWEENKPQPESGKTVIGYPATYYAVVAYENDCPAPAGSSGWFLPSIGQMWKVYQQRSLLTSVDGSSLRDEYWSSSEEGNGYSDQSDRFVLSVHVQRGRVNGCTKDGIYCYVRPVLAF